MRVLGMPVLCVSLRDACAAWVLLEVRVVMLGVVLKRGRVTWVLVKELALHVHNSPVPVAAALAVGHNSDEAG
nr:hypothetical protein BaRGS_020333 [Batillaria attramentaria]